VFSSYPGSDHFRSEAVIQCRSQTVKQNFLFWRAHGNSGSDLGCRRGASAHRRSALARHEAGKRAQRGEVSYEAHWEILGKELRLSPGNIEEFQRAFWAGDKLDHELINYIRSLRGRYKTGLLSNAFSDLRHMVEAVWKIGDAFDVLVISAEVGVVKPDPQIYQIALEKLGVDAQEAVFIDDFDRNVAAARELNLHGIHFRNPVQVRADLNDLL
jgi:epoxide hydrolase-like predicted phosphatase